MSYQEHDVADGDVELIEWIRRSVYEQGLPEHDRERTEAAVQQVMTGALRKSARGRHVGGDR